VAYRLKLQAQREECEPFELTFTENALPIHFEDQNEIDEGKYIFIPCHAVRRLIKEESFPGNFCVTVELILPNSE
jgi:hypothetical protein